MTILANVQTFDVPTLRNRCHDVFEGQLIAAAGGLDPGRLAGGGAIERNRL